MLGTNLQLMPTDLRSPISPLDSPALSQPPKNAGIVHLTVDVPDASRRSRVSHEAPKWRTLEFLIYGVVFCVAIPVMVWIPVSLSYTSHPNFPAYHRKLSPGWLFGRQVDDSDHQYQTFRDNVPILTILVGVFLSLKAVYTMIVRRFLSPQQESKIYLIPFLVAFSVLLLAALHGASSLKIITIISINYLIAKRTGASNFGPILTWIFNIAVLFANEWYSGYQFASIHPSLGYLDSLSGLHPRWYINFNISMLRLIAFNMDYHWACNRIGTIDRGGDLGYKERTTAFHSLDTYSYANYVAYILYPPLYLAGPIMSFNDFMWQLRRPLRKSLPELLGYFVRFIFCILTLEFILHFMYMVAIKDTQAWQGDSAAELGMIGFWNLVIVWLKLLVPWRFFRLWALVDGIDPPENMIRCVANNYSVLGFWRSWHRSYNLWIVRYIYIPLGGTQHVILTTILVFTFVALWHDLSMKLLAWGWLASLFFIPEISARYLLPARKYGDKWWYRHACAVGAVGNILMLMAANLVGFVLGTDGVSYMVVRLFSHWDGIFFLTVTSLCLFVGAQIMFEYRSEEARKGIFRRC